MQVSAYWQSGIRCRLLFFYFLKDEIGQQLPAESVEVIVVVINKFPVVNSHAVSSLIAAEKLHRIDKKQSSRCGRLLKDPIDGTRAVDGVLSLQSAEST